MPENLSAAPSAASSAPAGSASSTPAPVPATAGPANTGATPGTPPAAQVADVRGPIPYDRHEAILKNAREKARQEIDAEYQQRYQKYDSFEQDPWSAVQGWLSQASQHSLYRPLVEQWVNQYVGSQDQGQIGEEPQANVPIVDSQGNVTGHTYSDSALKQWYQWQQAQQNSALENRLAPLEQYATSLAEREQAIQSHEYSMSRASETLGTLRQQPYFQEHEADIKQALAEHEEWGDNVHAAYNHVLVTKILPNLSNSEQQRVLNDLSLKATGVSVAPGGTGSGRPDFKGSFGNAARYYNDHPEEAAVMARLR